MTEKKDVPAFVLQNADDAFVKKSDDLFACLQTLEDKHKAYEKARAGNSSSSEDDECGLLKQDPSEEETETITSAFKKPGEFSTRSHGHKSKSYQNIDQRSNLRHIQDHRSNQNRPWQRGNQQNRGKRSYVPDFQDRPQKWTKYSLEDVDEMNESSNRGAAFAFLEERKKMREGQDRNDDDDIKLEDTACSKGLFTFKRPDKSTIKGRESKYQEMKNKNDSASEKNEKVEKLKSDMESNEHKDSGVEDIDVVDSDNRISEESSDKSCLVTFKSNRNRKSRNIRKKEGSNEEED